MATTFSTPFMVKPDAGIRLGDIRSIWDAVANSNGVSAAYGIAAAGTNQATAVQLTSVINQIDTVAASTGVALPSSKGSRATPFQYCILYNNGASTLTVYAAVPPSGTADTINGVAGATGITVPASTLATFVSAKPGVWFSDTDTSGAFGAITTTSIVNTGSITTAGIIDSSTLSLTTIGSGIIQKAGANGKVGTFTLTGTTAVTVSNTSISTSDAIIISLSVVGGTVGAVPAIKTITAATGFTVAGTAADTSTYNYAVLSNTF